MKQCELRRGTTRQIVWIQTELAVPGKYLKIKGEDGWLVESVYAPVCENLLRTNDGRNFKHLLESIS